MGFYRRMLFAYILNLANCCFAPLSLCVISIGKESSLRHEFEKEITKMQQNEEAKSREYERRICLLEEECATAEERHRNAEVEVNSCKQQLRVELEARAMAEKEVDRLTRLLDDQVSRTKTALQSLLLQTGFYSS